MLVAIAVAEMGFWVLIAAGLTLRYLAHRPRAGLALLAATPVLDLFLVGVSTWDLSRGGTATTFHAFAAVYVGVSLAFGSSIIAWADVRAARRLIGGPPPPPKPPPGPEKTRRDRRGWLRHLLAWAIGCGLLLLATAIIGDAERTAALLGTAGTWTVVLAIDGLFSLPASQPRPGTGRRTDRQTPDWNERS